MHLQIREANKFDMPALLNMLHAYSLATPLEFLKFAWDAEYATKILTDSMAGRGLVLVAEKTEPIGMLVATINPSQWQLNKFLMTELAYWVQPEHRGSTAGYRLLKSYQQKGNELKAQKRIENFLISKMSCSPDLKFDKFGFSKLEEFWVQ